MSTQREKFELFLRLQSLGFTYEESQALRRIEMTLQRWAEAECNGEIQRDEKTGKPYRHTYQDFGILGESRNCYPIADREAGALKRLAAIVKARNDREVEGRFTEPRYVYAYNQTDPRGCALYLLTREQVGSDPIGQIYSRGLAVCA